MSVAENMLLDDSIPQRDRAGRRRIYLHRKKGDQGNATYWYSRAGKPVCREPLDVEWLSIIQRYEPAAAIKADVTQQFCEALLESSQTKDR
jgi:hypothetical protein